MRNEILKKVQDEGLAILKLHEKLNELNIEHEFIDRKEERTKRIKEEEVLYIVNHIYPFDYQIILYEKENEISLIQNSFSYGITKNLIEVYNFDDEPIIIDCDYAAELIINKKLNSFIIASNVVINDINENPEKILEKFKINH